MGAEIELHRLVDLALRSPDAGVVNFNHLHTLLHAILNHIGLSYDPLSGEINTKLAASTNEADGKSTRTEQLEAEDKASKEEDRSNRPDKSSELGTASSESESNDNSLQKRQENLEQKVQELEERLKILDNPPSNQFIIEQAQQSKHLNQDEAVTQTTLSGLWQFMKFNKRLQATEEAIDRVMTILNEFLGTDGNTITSLKSDVEDVANELKNLKESILGQTKSQDGNLGQKPSTGAFIEGDAMLRLNLIEKELGSRYVTKDELSVYVKWPALEEALNVKKTDLERENRVATGAVALHPEETPVKDSDHHVNESEEVDDTESDGRPQSAPLPPTLQTPIPAPEHPKTAFTRSTQVNGQELLPAAEYPSQEMVECLRQIGELSDKQTQVEKHVASVVESQQEMAGELAKVEHALPQKVSKEDLNIPDDLQDQLAMLKQGLEFLNTNQDLVALAEIKNMALNNKDHIEGIKRELAIIARQNKPAFTGVVSQSPGVDSSVLDALREHLTDLQAEQEKLVLTADRQHSEVAQDMSRKQEHIDALYSYVEKLQVSKADKENVALEMNIKADKAALDSKVNVSTFDNTFNMLDEGLREALQKMDDYMNEEMALKQALKQLSTDMSEKMDGQAFQALKNYLERRIADVQKSRNLIAAETKVDFSDAAGFRKQVKFNCISCSRPVELPLRGPNQSNLPFSRGVRTKRSKGPYLSFEMDQIRQYQRGHYGGGKAERSLNEIISGRPCGGSHTVMYHPKRRTKTTQLNQVLAREEPTEIPNWGREMSVIDLLKGSDGHVYKGRFRQTIPPIPKNSRSTPLEHEFSSFAKEESLLSSNSGPDSPRNAGAGQAAEEISPKSQNSLLDTHQMNQSRNTSPRARMRHIVKRHSSDSPPVPVPSPSPPTVRDSETHKTLPKQQRQEDTQSKLFTPTIPRPSPDGGRENEDTDPGGTGKNTDSGSPTE